MVAANVKSYSSYRGSASAGACPPNIFSQPPGWLDGLVLIVSCSISVRRVDSNVLDQSLCGFPLQSRVPCEFHQNITGPPCSAALSIHGTSGHSGIGFRRDSQPSSRRFSEMIVPGLSHVTVAYDSDPIGSPTSAPAAATYLPPSRPRYLNISYACTLGTPSRSRQELTRSSTA